MKIGNRMAISFGKIGYQTENERGLTARWRFMNPHPFAVLSRKSELKNCVNCFFKEIIDAGLILDSLIDAAI